MLVAAAASVLSDDGAAPVSFCWLCMRIPDSDDLNFGVYNFFARSEVEDVNNDADFLRIGPFAVASFLGSFFRA